MVCEQNLLTFNNFIVTTDVIWYTMIYHNKDSSNYNRRAFNVTLPVNPKELNNLTIHLEGKCGMDKRSDKRQEEDD